MAGFSLASLVARAEPTHFVGGDISLLPLYQSSGSQYQDENGNKIELLPYLHDLGMNAMRVRLFVDPASYPGEKDPNACQTLPYLIPLCQDIIANGMEVMLDFHYSDTWADPKQQYIPEAWKNLTEEELVQKIYDYTKETLQTLKENGITPAFIQPGNEISYGMLWGPYGASSNSMENNKPYINSGPAPWQRLCNLLKSAIKACREECPDAKIIIHTERVSEIPIQKNFYEKMEEYEVDYDIIGLSYYPYFHGNMSVLDDALNSLEANFPEKPIMIVETGYPYAWEVPGTDHSVDYPYTLDGQDTFAHELVDTLLAHESVDGLFWWWLEYNAYGTQLSNWYNAPLFDSRTGKATPALKTICSFATGFNAIDDLYNDESSSKDSRWYDLNGNSYSTPPRTGIYIHQGKKIVIPN